MPLLRKAKVNTLYIGTNGGPESHATALNRGLQPVTSDKNATMFRWRDPPSGEEVTVLYTSGYGSFINGHVSEDTCQIASNGVAMVSYFESDKFVTTHLLLVVLANPKQIL